MVEQLDRAAVEALYAETPHRFIAARNELVADLSGSGSSDAAKEAASLRKPTVAAWAVNRIARDHSHDIHALIDLGKDLASAQRAVAAGGGADRLHEAGSERRRLVELLVRASAEALESEGMSAARATLDKVSNTLMAMATDQDAAERVRRGVLDKELPAPSGFGDKQLDAGFASVSELPKRAITDGPENDARDWEGQRERQEAIRHADRLAADALKLEKGAERLEQAAKTAKVKATEARGSATAARRKADAAGRQTRKDREQGDEVRR